ncbi:MAG: Fis family transcriptional regulator, partial [Pseudomonadota bacterium]
MRPTARFFAAYDSAPLTNSQLLPVLANSRDPVAQALAACMRDDSADAIVAAIDRLLPTLGEDPLDVFLMLYWAVRLTGLGSHLDLAAALITRAESYEPPAERRSLAVLACCARAYLAGRRGDPIGRELGLERACAILPPDHPRHLAACADHALLLAQQGRLGERPADAATTLAERWPALRQVFGFAQWIDAVERGAWEEARSIRPADAAHPVGQRYRTMRDYADAITAAASGTHGGSPAVFDPQHALLPQAVPMLLRSQRYADALQCARHQARQGLSGHESWHLHLIHAELANRHVANAQRLLGEARSRRRPGPADTCLALSLALAHGADEDAIDSAWQAAKSCVERLGAWGRLGWELDLACTLPPSRTIRLLRGDADRRRVPAAAAKPPAPRGPLDGLVGSSPAMAAVRERLAELAAADCAVLLLGETGTGKELAARALHQLRTPDLPFVAINCAAIADELLESELFGHERGAFTGAFRSRRGLVESAAGGTLLLDEIGDTSPRFQAALLRLIDNREYRPVGGSDARRAHCRFIAATSRDPRALISAGGFRADLYYRLHGASITLPPLRERGRDAVEIARQRLNGDRRDGRPCLPTPAFDDALLGLPWPGNVRELLHCIDLMRALSSDTHQPDLPDLLRALPAAAAPLLAQAQGSAAAAQGSAARRLARLRALLAERGRLARREVMAELLVSGTTATAYMRRLVAEGTAMHCRPTGRAAES